LSNPVIKTKKGEQRQELFAIYLPPYSSNWAIMEMAKRNSHFQSVSFHTFFDWRSHELVFERDFQKSRRCIAPDRYRL